MNMSQSHHLVAPKFLLAIAVLFGSAPIPSPAVAMVDRETTSRSSASTMTLEQIAGNTGQTKTATTPRVEKARSPCEWAGYDWDDMTQSERNAWTKLGWDRASWDAGIPPASDRKDWDQLTERERAAAMSLGITKRSWDLSRC